MAVNKVILIGNLGSDPETRYTPSGAAVANFSLATTEQWTSKEGAKEEKTEWHKIVAFGRLGEICDKYLHKGKQVYIEGKIQTRSWEDKDGIKRYSTEIIANSMQMLGSARKDKDNDAWPPARKDDDIPSKNNKKSYVEEYVEQSRTIPDDDIPF